MNIFKKLLGKEKPLEAKVSMLPLPNLYNLGWKIHLKEGRSTSSEWERVSENKLVEVNQQIEAEVKAVYDSLEKAHKSKKEFVMLNNNVFRLADVISITRHNYKI
jgi:hypothetical protein